MVNWNIPSVGVEEEYQLVDRESGELIPNCKQVMGTLRNHPRSEDCDADIQHELHLNQIEMASDVCQTLDDVRRSLRQTRGLLIEAAEQGGIALAASGTNPLSVPNEPALTPKERYRRMSQRFQQIARELFIFGCHVHVSMSDRRLGIEVMNRSRRWLPILQALTSNSPFWDGRDTGYASYRRELWAQWPMAGSPPHFEHLDDYESCISDLIGSEAIQDESFIYWDIRLPAKIPTIEFRGADVITSIDETVGYVGLVRALVMQSRSEILDGRDRQSIHSSVLSFALWQAARYGMSHQLIDPLACEKIAAADHCDRLLDFITPALKQSGDRNCVEAYINRLINQGSGADRQRRAASGGDNLIRVVQATVKETAQGVTTA